MESEKMKKSQLKQLIREHVIKIIEKYDIKNPLINIDKKTVSKIKDYKSAEKLINKFIKDHGSDYDKVSLDLFGQRYPLISELKKLKKLMEKDNYYIKGIHTNTKWNEYEDEFKINLQVEKRMESADFEARRQFGTLD